LPSGIRAIQCPIPLSDGTWMSFPLDIIGILQKLSHCHHIQKLWKDAYGYLQAHSNIPVANAVHRLPLCHRLAW
jgi:hypothetical protein